MWKVRVETSNGEVREFTALDLCKPTEGQKLLWKRVMSGGRGSETIETEDEKVTQSRIKVVSEVKL